MNDRKCARKSELTRKRLFFGGCFLGLALFTALIVFVIISVFSSPQKTEGVSSVVSVSVSSETVESKIISSETVSSEAPVSSDVQSQTESVSQKYILDENYTNLLLVNGTNPLPENYDYEGNLVSVDTKYINGSLKQIDKTIESYLLAMIEDAWADGVKLYIRSPYRSYSTQKMLYDNQVKRCLDKGLSQIDAENEAATVVARPGTSEHHTGLAVDFNIADDSFENMPAYNWLIENAADYGFIMRYSKEKQSITGVIYESWHWRFVGINVAKEMNTLGMCLEEYVEYKKQG